MNRWVTDLNLELNVAESCGSEFTHEDIFLESLRKNLIAPNWIHYANEFNPT